MKSIRSFQKHILAWYKQNKRDLPWRRTIDPYKILVSEIMLQQTQVDRVIPKFNAFLKAFPTAKALAHAKTSDVLVHWSGLGFNRRALNLQKAAQAVVSLGGFPTTRSELLELPGVGPYTAGAILAFSKNEKSPVVDTNIRRIMSRFFLAGGTVQEVDNLAFASVPTTAARDWNNALMDFGSMVCTSGAPKCDSCPLTKLCRASSLGKQDAFLKVGKPQSKFKGSRREYRGKILKFLKDQADHKSTLQKVSSVIEKDTSFTKELVNELASEGFLIFRGRSVSLS